MVGRGPRVTELPTAGQPKDEPNLDDDTYYVDNQVRLRGNDNYSNRV
jgi:hypothetical protein